MPKTYAVADQDRSIVSIVFRNGINRRFLQMVRTVYGITDSDYNSLGLEKPIINEGGHAVIFYRRDKPIY